MINQINRLGAVLEAILKELPDGIVKRIGGALELAKTDAPPRVVLEPVSAVIEAPHGVKGALFTRAETVRAHIWGRDMSEVEELVELLFNGIVRVASWSFTAGSSQWKGEGATARGAGATYDIVLKIPILRREAVATLTDGGLTAEFVNTEELSA